MREGGVYYERVVRVGASVEGEVRVKVRLRILEISLLLHFRT